MGFVLIGDGGDFGVASDTWSGVLVGFIDGWQMFSSGSVIVEKTIIVRTMNRLRIIQEQMAHARGRR